MIISMLTLSKCIYSVEIAGSCLDLFFGCLLSHIALCEKVVR